MLEREGVKSPRARTSSRQALRHVLAARIRSYRLRRRWSVDTLAERCNLSGDLVVELERGTRTKVRLGLVERLARAFEVDIVDLLNPDDEGRRRRSGHEDRTKALGDRAQKRPAP